MPVRRRDALPEVADRSSRNRRICGRTSVLALKRALRNGWNGWVMAPSSSAIVTCRQAYDMLSARWGADDRGEHAALGEGTYPKLSNTLAADKLKHDLPIANAAFTGSASNYCDSMRQNTAINAFMQARNSMAGGSGAATIDTFAQTRADIQARNTYNSIAQQAMAWVPILNIVLTVVFFAMFPVIFPLFLMPQTGLASLKGYAMGFFYLAAWGLSMSSFT